MQRQFPLQTKRLRLLKTPWISVGVAECMNNAPRPLFHSFLFENAWNCSDPSSNYEGHTIGGGLLDGRGGDTCSRFVSDALQRVLKSHRVDPVTNRQELRRLQRDEPQLASLLEAALSVPRTSSSFAAEDTKPFITNRDIQMYSAAIDAAYFQRYGIDDTSPASTSPSIRDEGCRSVWFAATLQDRSEPCVQLCTSNVGNARAFAIALNKKTTGGVQSVLDLSRHRMIPLSRDHIPRRSEEYTRITLAGGVVSDETNGLIDAHPDMDVSRSFGHWFMKNKTNRSPTMQKLIAEPNTFSTTLNSGDVLVLANFSAFSTRSGEPTDVDSVARVVNSALADGSSPDKAAAALCDYAITFGAGGGIQVMVARVEDLSSVTPQLRSSPRVVRGEQRIDPGPIYPGAVQASPLLYKSLESDAARCGVSLPQLLALRWAKQGGKRRGDTDHGHSEALRHFMSMFPREGGMLQQILSEEEAFFGAGPPAEEDAAAAFFAKLASSLKPTVPAEPSI